MKRGALPLQTRSSALPFEEAAHAEFPSEKPTWSDIVEHALSRAAGYATLALVIGIPVAVIAL